MLGIVTAITMKLDPLSFANMIPQKKPVALTIPPPIGFEVPKNIDMSGITDKMLKDAFEEFVDRCKNDYYVEYFWFPSNSRCWINCWKNDAKAEGAERYPSPTQVKLQATSLFLNEVANNSIFKVLPGKVQLKVISNLAMRVLPDRKSDDPIVTPVSEALHFRRGIQNFRCSDMEWEIPIPGLKSNPAEPDYSVIQKAWWAVIKQFYDHFKEDENVAMWFPLELRITGGSSVNIAPQFGNHEHGTCSIEILTPENVDRAKWQAFMQETTDLWVNLKTDEGEAIHPFKNGDGFDVYCR